MPSRSAPTATTVAPYAGSALAPMMACRFVPAPETSTTSLAFMAATLAEPFLCSLRPKSLTGQDHREQKGSPVRQNSLRNGQTHRSPQAGNTATVQVAVPAAPTAPAAAA